MGSERYAIGVDLGGTKIAAAAVDETGKIQNSILQPTDADGGPLVVIRQIVEMVRHLCQDQPAAPLGVGVGVAGQVAPQTGLVRFAPNLVWHEVPLQTNLDEALGIPVRVANDVRMAAWGEWLFGAGQGCEDLICIYVGTGVGGGIVSGGHMLTGHGNTAGEVGHITVDMNGPVCTCGNQGCLEAFSGGWAIARKAQDAALHHPLVGASILKLAGNRLADISAETVARAYNQKDPLSQRIMSGVVEALVAGTVTMINMVGPRRVIMGGGVIEGLPELVGRVENGVRRRALKAATESIQFMPAQLGTSAGMIGAAALVLRTLSTEALS
ncbi:MAG: ROK family protein [Desulfatitalea sp. BRH_c12]|nr:MAG: ROK family protein [Desulfatitalea sp. BRH_c12]